MSEQNAEIKIEDKSETERIEAFRTTSSESGEKTFEIRRNDRGFQKGDVLVLEKWSPREHSMYQSSIDAGGAPARPHGCYIDREGTPCHRGLAATTRVRVTYVLNSENLRPGFVALAIQKEDSYG